MKSESYTHILLRNSQMRMVMMISIRISVYFLVLLIFTKEMEHMCMVVPPLKKLIANRPSRELANHEEFLES